MDIHEIINKLEEIGKKSYHEDVRKNISRGEAIGEALSNGIIAKQTIKDIIATLEDNFNITT